MGLWPGQYWKSNISIWGQTGNSTGGFGATLDGWYTEDPNDDAGLSFSDKLAILGPFSGLDIKGLYAHYDTINDIMYGMGTVYGLPGDLDGDGDSSGNCFYLGDCLGDSGPAGSGIGESEIFIIRISQNGNFVVT